MDGLRTVAWMLLSAGTVGFWVNLIWYRAFKGYAAGALDLADAYERLITAQDEEILNLNTVISYLTSSSDTTLQKDLP